MTWKCNYSNDTRGGKDTLRGERGCPRSHIKSVPDSCSLKIILSFWISFPLSAFLGVTAEQWSMRAVEGKGHELKTTSPCNWAKTRDAMFPGWSWGSLAVKLWLTVSWKSYLLSELNSDWCFGTFLLLQVKSFGVPPCYLSWLPALLLWQAATGKTQGWSLNFFIPCLF